MAVQGSEIINQEYFNSLTQQVNDCTSCDQLKALVTDSFQSLFDQQDAMNSQMADLQPLLELLKPPTTINAAVSWISNFINEYLEPQLKPATEYEIQIAAFQAQVAELTLAVTKAASNLTNCSVSIPSPPSIPGV